MRRVIYVAHPVAPTEEELAAAISDSATPDGRPDAISFHAERIVRANIQSALRCLAWLRSSFPETTFIASWIAGVQSVGGDGTPEDRERGLVDCCAVVERCDGLVHMGRRISSGMRREEAHGQASKFVRFQPWDDPLVSVVVTCKPFLFTVDDLTGPLDIQFVPVQVGITFAQYMAGRR
jgi:hypothetical protein